MDLVIEALSNVDAGTVLAWLISLGAIIGSICVVSVKFYKAIENYRKIRNESEKKDNELKGHTTQIKKLQEDMITLSQTCDDLKTVDKIQTRQTLINACNRFLDEGHIDSYQLQALEDLYETYTNVLHGNSYTKTLMNAVRSLRVTSREGIPDVKEAMRQEQ